MAAVDMMHGKTDKGSVVMMHEKTDKGSPPLEDSVEVADMETMALKALHVDDDSSLNPWTVRMFVLGLSLGSFGATLATIFMFRPQPVDVSAVFLTVISYVLGNGMAWFVPRRGRLGRWLNPHSFNSKEHLAVVLMASSASGVAYATEVLAVLKLYYGVVPGPVLSVALMISSQIAGYGMAGVLRKSLVYPTRMLWPSVLPLNSLMETLHRERSEMGTRFHLFWAVLAATAVWELLPQYVMPLLVGISAFCLANRKSLVFTNIFGGGEGNEGLGLLSLCFDWQNMGTDGFTSPLITVTNAFIGYVLGMALFAGLYYGNVWQALKFPFLSQQLFSSWSNSTSYVVYNQSAVLGSGFVLDESKLDAQGLPHYTATFASYLMTTNLGVTATLVHILLWNRDVVRVAFGDMASWLGYVNQPSLLFRRRQPDHAVEDDETDPHYLKMLAYAEVPSLWYVGLLVSSAAVALVCLYVLESTLPWWGFLVALLVSFSATLFFGAMDGMIGFMVPISSLVQLIGGLMHPGRPVANMFFVLFGANAQSQALHLVANLKLGQYGKLRPRCTFLVTLMGTAVGGVLNCVVMSSITTNQRDILLSTEGTNIWSGKDIQSFNSNAIAFGALSSHMFGPNGTYRWVVLALPLGLVIPIPFWLAHRWFPRAGFDYIITPVISWFAGFLCEGINSSVGMSFVVAFLMQFWARKRHPAWFLKYNYVLAAAVSGGTELLVFVASFAVQGASGAAIPFPTWWGNPEGNVDYCMRNPASSGG